MECNTVILFDGSQEAFNVGEFFISSQSHCFRTLRAYVVLLTARVPEAGDSAENR
jgi:hypothetical protein